MVAVMDDGISMDSRLPRKGGPMAPLTDQFDFESLYSIGCEGRARSLRTP
jgi:hypothetical protein